MDNDKEKRIKLELHKGEGKGTGKRIQGLPSIVSLVKEKGLQEKLLRSKTGWEVEKTVRRILASLDSVDEKALTIATFLHKLGYDVRCSVGGFQILLMKPKEHPLQGGFHLTQGISSGEITGTFMITKFDETFTEAEIGRIKGLLFRCAKFEPIE